MFKRKIENELQRWKDSKDTQKGAFLLKGLRQIGKTTTIRHFAEENYKYVYYINFKLQPQYKKAFADSLEVSALILNLSAMQPLIPFLPHETVLIFDEIQECSGARASLKSFAEDRRFDVIASGSMLGIKGYNHKYSGGVPVGFEHTVYMRPMDFEEFLWAKGISSEILELMKNSLDTLAPLPLAIHEALTRYFREYICVGGMPSVVDTFIQTGDFSKVLAKQKDILEGFKDDYGKHLDENENEKVNLTLLASINRVFDRIPAELAKENKKFQYVLLGKQASASKYAPAIEWLRDYGLIELCHNLSLPARPLEGYKDPDSFKIYLTDTGLFTAMLDPGTQGEILQGNLGVYRGAIYENVIADAFGKNGKALYYFAKASGLEIDFVTLRDRKVTLVEVKAKDGNAKSAKAVLGDKTRYEEVEGFVKISEKNISVLPNGFSIPHYLAFLL